MPVIRVSEAESPGENKEEYIIPCMLGIVLRISQLTLLAPLSLRRAYDRWAVVKIYPGLAKYQRLLLFLLNIVLLPTMIHQFLGINNQAIIRTAIGVCCVVFIPMWAYGQAMFYSTGKLMRLIPLLRQIHKINKSFKCTVTKSRQLETCLLCLYVAWQFIEVAILIIASNSLKNDLHPILSAMGTIIWYQHFVIGLQLLQWDLIIYEIKLTLSNLNDELQSWLESSAVTNISHIRHNMKTNRVNMKTCSLEGLTNMHPRASIYHISDCYEEICDIVQKVDEDSGTFLMLMITLIFWRSLLTPYNFLVALDSKDLGGMARQATWSFFHLCQLLSIVEPSHRLQQQQHRTRGIVGKLAGELGRWDMNMAHLEPLLLQVQMQDAACAPMGMFRIARPLVASMVGAVVTSLIIIVQFRKLTDFAE